MGSIMKRIKFLLIIGLAGIFSACSSAIDPAVISTSQSTQTPKPNEYFVIAQLNLWYDGPGCNGGFEDNHCSGRRTIPFLRINIVPG